MSPNARKRIVALGDDLQAFMQDNSHLSNDAAVREFTASTTACRTSVELALAHLFDTGRA